ncbi:hypothetical protein HY642_05375 [Candidatus Woesearchaeota archaeon]|nr:hypothetical protein [Candidatus Woesearchaeota archaeon]
MAGIGEDLGALHALVEQAEADASMLLAQASVQAVGETPSPTLLKTRLQAIAKVLRRLQTQRVSDNFTTYITHMQGLCCKC